MSTFKPVYPFTCRNNRLGIVAAAAVGLYGRLSTNRNKTAELVKVDLTLLKLEIFLCFVPWETLAAAVG